MGTLIMWLGVVLAFAFPLLLPLLNMGGAVSPFQLAGAVIMCVGWVLMALHK